MPKFKVLLQQYVEQTAEMIIEAADEDEAREKALNQADCANWGAGDDAYEADVYMVLNADGEMVWER